MSQNYISRIEEDKRGFIWFGTKDGLNRYDGYNFKIFRNNPFDATTLSGNWITALFADSKNRLWSGTSDLDLFDASTESFIRFKLREKNQILIRQFPLKSFQ